MNFCPKCGTPITQGAMFCKKCGYRLAPQPTPGQQPATPDPTAPAAGEAPKKKNTKKTVLITLGIVLGLGALGTGGYFLWDHFFNDDSSAPVAAKADKEDSDKSKEDSTNTEELNEQADLADNEAAEDQRASKLAYEYHTTTYPKTADLKWYIEEVMLFGVPDGVTRYTNMHYIEGGWKGFIYYDPTNSQDSEVMHFVNFNFSGTPDRVKMITTWYGGYDVNADEGFDLSNDDPSVFMGKWNNGRLDVDGPGNIHFTAFWEKDGHQYAIGTYDSPDGCPANVAMCR